MNSTTGGRNMIAGPANQKPLKEWEQKLFDDERLAMTGDVAAVLRIISYERRLRQRLQRKVDAHVSVPTAGLASLMEYDE